MRNYDYIKKNSFEINNEWMRFQIYQKSGTIPLHNKWKKQELNSKVIPNYINLQQSLVYTALIESFLIKFPN